jgi:hypothetical protein
MNEYKKILIFTLLLHTTNSLWTMEWIKALFQTAKEQEATKKTIEEEKKSKITLGKAALDEQRQKQGISPKKESTSIFAGAKRSFQQTFNPKAISTITKDISLKLGIGREQTYSYFSPDSPIHKEFFLGNSDQNKPAQVFAIEQDDTVADIAIVHNKKNEYKCILLVGKHDKDKKITDSTIYIGNLPENQEGNSFIPLMNESEKNASHIVDEDKNKIAIKSPNRISSNGSHFYFTQIDNDKLYECALPPDLKNVQAESVNRQTIKQYAGLFGTDLTVTQLAKIKGDFATQNIFFASKAPNLYRLDHQATAKFRDEIAGAGYLLDIYQNTLIYGRLYDENEWYKVLWDKFTGKLRQFKAFVTGTEGGGKQGTTVRRIGYYAKFYGSNDNGTYKTPTQISLDEDYEEAKMMAPVDTVIYGDVVKNYVMVPAAASALYAVVFIGRRRGMHFAIQSNKGMLFPKMLSWYKILKHSLYSDGGAALNIAPEDTLPRKLFIVQHAKNEHYLCIVMRSHVFLMMTPLEKIDANPNKNYNVAMSCIYKPDGGRSKKKIVASSFFAQKDFNAPQPLFLVVRNEDAQILQDKFKLLFFDDLHKIIEAQKIKLNAEKGYNQASKTWTWVTAKHELGQEEE